MAHINKTWFAAFCAALFFLGVQACTDSNFAGSGAGKSAGLTGKNKGKDGTDSGPDSDGPDSGGPDASDGPDGGGGDDSDGPDGPGGGLDEDDTSDTGGPDAGSDDGEVSTKTRHDAVITRGEHETPFDLKIEVVIKGKTASTQTVSFGDNGDQQIAKLACRNAKDTCMKLTFTNTDDNDENGHIEVVGGTPNAATTCAWAQETGNSAIIDVDMDGDEQSGIFDQGTCMAADKDDQITITCPQAKKLQVQLCTGG